MSRVRDQINRNRLPRGEKERSYHLRYQEGKGGEGRYFPRSLSKWRFSPRYTKPLASTSGEFAKEKNIFIVYLSWIVLSKIFTTKFEFIVGNAWQLFHLLWRISACNNSHKNARATGRMNLTAMYSTAEWQQQCPFLLFLLLLSGKCAFSLLVHSPRFPPAFSPPPLFPRRPQSCSERRRGRSPARVRK